MYVILCVCVSVCMYVCVCVRVCVYVCVFIYSTVFAEAPAWTDEAGTNKEMVRTLRYLHIHARAREPSMGKLTRLSSNRQISVNAYIA